MLSDKMVIKQFAASKFELEHEPWKIDKYYNNAF